MHSRFFAVYMLYFMIFNQFLKNKIFIIKAQIINLYTFESLAFLFCGSFFSFDSTCFIYRIKETLDMYHIIKMKKYN